MILMNKLKSKLKAKNRTFYSELKNSKIGIGRLLLKNRRNNKKQVLLNSHYIIEIAKIFY